MCVTFVSAMKIQISTETKSALDELGSYIMEKRGQIMIKVTISLYTV